MSWRRFCPLGYWPLLLLCCCCPWPAAAQRIFKHHEPVYECRWSGSTVCLRSETEPFTLWSEVDLESAYNFTVAFGPATRNRVVVGTHPLLLMTGFNSSTAAPPPFVNDYRRLMIMGGRLTSSVDVAAWRQHAGPNTLANSRRFHEYVAGHSGVSAVYDYLGRVRSDVAFVGFTAAEVNTYLTRVRTATGCTVCVYDQAGLPAGGERSLWTASWAAKPNGGQHYALSILDLMRLEIQPAAPASGLPGYMLFYTYLTESAAASPRVLTTYPLFAYIQFGPTLVGETSSVGWVEQSADGTAWTPHPDTLHPDAVKAVGLQDYKTLIQMMAGTGPYNPCAGSTQPQCFIVVYPTGVNRFLRVVWLDGYGVGATARGRNRHQLPFMYLKAQRREASELIVMPHNTSPIPLRGACEAVPTCTTVFGSQASGAMTPQELAFRMTELLGPWIGPRDSYCRYASDDPGETLLRTKDYGNTLYDPFATVTDVSGATRMAGGATENCYATNYQTRACYASQSFTSANVRLAGLPGFATDLLAVRNTLYVERHPDFTASPQTFLYPMVCFGNTQDLSSPLPGTRSSELVRFCVYHRPVTGSLRLDDYMYVTMDSPCASERRLTDATAIAAVPEVTPNTNGCQPNQCQVFSSLYCACMEQSMQRGALMARPLIFPDLGNFFAGVNVERTKTFYVVRPSDLPDTSPVLWRTVHLDVMVLDDWVCDPGDSEHGARRLCNLLLQLYKSLKLRYVQAVRSWRGLLARLNSRRAPDALTRKAIELFVDYRLQDAETTDRTLLPRVNYAVDPDSMLYHERGLTRASLLDVNLEPGLSSVNAVAAAADPGGALDAYGRGSYRLNEFNVLTKRLSTYVDAFRFNLTGVFPVASAGLHEHMRLLEERVRELRELTRDADACLGSADTRACAQMLDQSESAPAFGIRSLCTLVGTPQFGVVGCYAPREKTRAFDLPVLTAACLTHPNRTREHYRVSPAEPFSRFVYHGYVERTFFFRLYVVDVRDSVNTASWGDLSRHPLRIERIPSYGPECLNVSAEYAVYAPLREFVEQPEPYPPANISFSRVAALEEQALAQQETLRLQDQALRALNASVKAEAALVDALTARLALLANATANATSPSGGSSGSSGGAGAEAAAAIAGEALALARNLSLWVEALRASQNETTRALRDELAAQLSGVNASLNGADAALRAQLESLYAMLREDIVTLNLHANISMANLTALIDTVAQNKRQLETTVRDGLAWLEGNVTALTALLSADVRALNLSLLTVDARVQQLEQQQQQQPWLEELRRHNASLLTLGERADALNASLLLSLEQLRQETAPALRAHNASLQTLSERATAQDETLLGVQSRAQTLNRTVEDLSSRLQQLQQQQQQLQQNSSADAATRLEALNASATALRERVERLETNATASRERVDRLETNATALRERAERLETNVSRLETGAETQNAGLQSVRAALEALSNATGLEWDALRALIAASDARLTALAASEANATTLLNERIDRLLLNTSVRTEILALLGQLVARTEETLMNETRAAERRFNETTAALRLELVDQTTRTARAYTDATVNASAAQLALWLDAALLNGTARLRVDTWDALAALERRLNATLSDTNHTNAASAEAVAASLQARLDALNATHRNDTLTLQTRLEALNATYAADTGSLLARLDSVNATHAADTGSLLARLDSVNATHAADTGSLLARLDSVNATRQNDTLALQSRLDALNATQWTDASTLRARVDALNATQSTDAWTLRAQVDALNATQSADSATLSARMDALNATQSAGSATLSARMDALNATQSADSAAARARTDALNAAQSAESAALRVRVDWLNATLLGLQQTPFSNLTNASDVQSALLALRLEHSSETRRLEAEIAALRETLRALNETRQQQQQQQQTPAPDAASAAAVSRLQEELRSLSSTNGLAIAGLVRGLNEQRAASDGVLTPAAATAVAGVSLAVSGVLVAYTAYQALTSAGSTLARTVI